jgi:type II secretion system protein J
MWRRIRFVAHKPQRRLVGSQRPAVSGPRVAARFPFARRRPPTAGFTLVEVLIALALVSTIATMVYGSYAAACRSLDLYGDRLACTERACLVLRLLSRQVRCAYAPPARTVSTSPSRLERRPTVFHGDSRAAGGTILSFVTTGGPGDGPEGATALARIRYRYEPASETLSICQDPYRNETDARESSESWRPILHGVRRMELQFLDGGQWHAEWTGSDSERLPQAVRIALTVVDEDSRPHKFGTTATIVCRKRLHRASPAAGVQEP